MKLKIISEGTAGTTKVVNAETGEELENVVAVMWEANAHKGPDAACQISLMKVQLECLGVA